MPRKPKDKGRKPETTTEVIRDAIADLSVEHEVEEKRKARDARRRGKAGRWRFIDRRILIALGVIVLILVADGIRRENREFSARVISFTGQVSLVDAAGETIALREGARLAAGAQVTTGPDAKATMELEDGSRVIVKSSSRMVVRGLDYNRGGRFRDHALEVNQGQVMASVGQRFGAGSELSVGTPGAVAAVRGTVFLVRYDMEQKQTYAACQEGEVEVSGNGIRWDTVPGGSYRGVDVAGKVYDRQPLPDPVAKEFLAEGELNLPPSKDPLMRRIEGALNGVLDPILSMVGVGKSSWGVLAGNRARVEAARLAARDLQLLFEGMTDLPTQVDLQTVAELSLTPSRRDQMLKQLAGNRLDGYVSNGRDYILLVRGKDREKTRFMATREGVVNVAGRPELVDDMQRQLGL